MKSLSTLERNYLRISIYLAGTGIAIAIPASLCCADLLLLRMNFDYHLFGVIKSSMFFMCRRNVFWGWVLIAFGLGLLFGMCLESGFWCSCGALLIICAGFFNLRRK